MSPSLRRSYSRNFSHADAAFRFSPYGLCRWRSAFRATCITSRRRRAHGYVSAPWPRTPEPHDLGCDSTGCQSRAAPRGLVMPASYSASTHEKEPRSRLISRVGGRIQRRDTTGTPVIALFHNLLFYLASPRGTAHSFTLNGIGWQPALSARIEIKGLLRGMANRTAGGRPFPALDKIRPSAPLCAE
jgi:hypothetical protein